MRYFPSLLPCASALAISCILTFVVPASASAPRKDASTQKESLRSNRETEPSKASHGASASSKRASIQARPRAESKKRRPSKTAQRPAERRGAEQPCLHDQVTVVAPQGTTPETIVLTRCDGRAAHGALAALARWLGQASRSAGATAPGVSARSSAGHEARQLGLLARLQAIATAFPGHTLKLHAPCASDAGRAAHQRRYAVDVDVEGIPAERQLEACRALPDTACGQVAGQGFVHLEARTPGAGHLYWVDLAGTSN